MAASDATMLHQISLHRLPDCCTGCNATNRLPRRFRSSARCRACGAGRLAIDPLGPFGAVGTLLVTSFEDGYDHLFVQQQLGHFWGSTTATYTSVGADYKNQALRRPLGPAIPSTPAADAGR